MNKRSKLKHDPEPWTPFDTSCVKPESIFFIGNMTTFTVDELSGKAAHGVEPSIELLCGVYTPDSAHFYSKTSCVSSKRATSLSTGDFFAMNGTYQDCIQIGDKGFSVVQKSFSIADVYSSKVKFSPFPKWATSTTNDDILYSKHWGTLDAIHTKEECFPVHVFSSKSTKLIRFVCFEIPLEVYQKFEVIVSKERKLIQNGLGHDSDKVFACEDLPKID